MLRRSLLTICLLIMAMWIFSACTSDPCIINPPGCVYGTCVTGVGTCDCYAGYEGDICDTAMDVESCVDPCVPYTPITTTDQLDPTGCETYIGAHPVHPGELLCCSDPTPPKEAPECKAGVDTPDIPCVVEFKFCEDGTAMKAFSPQPDSGYPGHIISESGTWSVNPVNGQLTVSTTAPAMLGGMITLTEETYSSAFTYDNGNKLDLNSAAAVSINEAGMGYYKREATNLTGITGIWSATLDAEMHTYLAVTGSGYESTFAQDITCSPAGGMVCAVTPKSDRMDTIGTHTLPLELYITPFATIYQSEEAKALVLERQPDPCDTIDCGANGFCEDGACVCTNGYAGEICDELTPCVGINCGANGTCVVDGEDYICECDTGYEGPLCGVNINECAPSPCLNSGTCLEGVPGTYICTCTGGFTGDICEICPTDADGDGYGNPASGLCINPELDCDDDHVTVYPGAPELCDGLDNQCAGDAGYDSIDEGYTACGAMVSIPTECFNMGDASAEGWADELPVHNVCLSPFEMDIHEITNAQYEECVDAEGCTAPKFSNSYSRGTYYGDTDYDNFPAIWLWWDDVVDYCAWAGKRLPTEAEWEYAARGGLAEKRYPWGDTISSANANYDFNVGDTTEVESYAPNGYGLFDMAGNVWEWVADWFNESTYSDSPTNDPTGPESGLARVRRGGSFDHSAFGLRNAVRCDFCHADRHGNNLGGRCAR